MTEQLHNNDPLLVRLMREQWHLVKLLATYAILAAVLYYLFNQFRSMPIYQDYLGALARAASSIVNFLGIDHTLQRAFLLENDDMIVTDVVNNRLVIDRHYDGFYPIILLIPAILVWGKKFVAKAIYLVFTIAAFVGLAAVRIAADVAVDQHFPLSYELAHWYLTPVFVVFIPVLLLFLIWARIAR